MHLGSAFSCIGLGVSGAGEGWHLNSGHSWSPSGRVGSLSAPPATQLGETGEVDIPDGVSPTEEMGASSQGFC